jgi:hypothetical protein
MLWGIIIAFLYYNYKTNMLHVIVITVNVNITCEASSCTTRTKTRMIFNDN